MKKIAITTLGFLCLILLGKAHARDGFVLALTATGRPLETVLKDVERAHQTGATHFNIPLLLCQESSRSTQVKWCRESSINAAIELSFALKKRGFTIGFLPFLLSADGQWRGFFKPANFVAWGASYLKRLEETVAIANEVGVSEFIVGTELNLLYLDPIPAEQAKRTAFWRKACARVRERLQDKNTKVIIVANWDQYDQIPFWEASDYIGLSAYYPLASSPASATTVEALTMAWRDWQKKIVAVADRYGKQLYFSEVGYASQANAAREPWSWEGALDLELQSRLYQSFGNVWAYDKAMSRKLARFQIWALDIAEDPMNNVAFPVLGKPAEAVLREVFNARR